MHGPIRYDRPLEWVAATRHSLMPLPPELEPPHSERPFSWCRLTTLGITCGAKRRRVHAVVRCTTPIAVIGDRRSYGRDCAPVDDILASVDSGRSVRGQERDQFGHFLRAVRPAEGNSAQCVHDALPCGLRAATRALRDLVDHPSRGLGFRVTGRDRVHPDPFGPDLLREALTVVRKGRL